MLCRILSGKPKACISSAFCSFLWAKPAQSSIWDVTHGCVCTAGVSDSGSTWHILLLPHRALQCQAGQCCPSLGLVGQCCPSLGLAGQELLPPLHPIHHTLLLSGMAQTQFWTSAQYLPHKCQGEKGCLKGFFGVQWLRYAGLGGWQIPDPVFHPFCNKCCSLQDDI